MKTDANGRTIFNSWDARQQDGTTKREEFAIKIMASLVRRSSMAPDQGDILRFAALAADGADALVRELNRNQK